MHWLGGFSIRFLSLLHAYVVLASACLSECCSQLIPWVYLSPTRRTSFAVHEELNQHYRNNTGTIKQQKQLRLELTSTNGATAKAVVTNMRTVIGDRPRHHRTAKVLMITQSIKIRNWNGVLFWCHPDFGLQFGRRFVNPIVITIIYIQFHFNIYYHDEIGHPR